MGPQPDPSEEMLAVQKQILAAEQERADRSERRMKEVRQTIAVILIIGLVLLVFMAIVMSTR